MKTCIKCMYYMPHKDESYATGNCCITPPVCISTEIMAFNWIRPVVHFSDTACKLYKKRK
jgi:hypothetical protein